MKQKTFFNRVLILFFIAILVVPVYWVARGKVEPQRSYMEYRTLNAFPALDSNDFKESDDRISQGELEEPDGSFFSQFQDLSFQNVFQLAVNDQMPFRSAGIRLSKDLTRVMIRIAYLFTGDEVIPADDHATAYEILAEKALIPEPPIYGEQNKLIIDEKLSNYENLINLHPAQNFYTFYIDVIENSTQNPITDPVRQTDQGRSFRYFKKNLPDGLTVESLMLNDIEDHLEYFYRTDHHWNTRGMLLGYEKIYTMLAQNYPAIGPILPHDTLYAFPDIEFHGRWSRAVFYKTRPGDPFEVALIDLPPYKIYDLNGIEIDYTKKEEYLAGDYSTAPFVDHYIEYNGEDVDFLEYVFENGAERNLLIIGDSFTNAIEPLLASHYHHTYAVDIRHWPDYYFSLSEFLSRYEVDDILILGGPSVVMYQSRWTISP